MDGQANEQVVRRSLDAFNARRWEDYAGDMAPDVVVEYPQSGERFVGSESCVAQVRAAPAEPRFQLKRLQSGGNLVVAEADQMYESGDSWQAVLIYEFDGGKVAKLIGYWSKPFSAPHWRKPFLAK